MPCKRLLVIVALSGLAASAQAGLKIYYLRHAESGANVEYQWKRVPRDEWPSYVGNADTFSPEGQSQLPGVVAKLEKLRLDFVGVSPLWRTRHTILPYLRAAGRKGEIWPELAEFDPRGREDALSAPLPEPSRGLFDGGSPIVLSADETDFFIVRPGAEHQCKLGEGGAQQEADRLALTSRVIGLLRERFGGTDKSILFVGHGNAGMLLASKLTNTPELMDGKERHILNATLWMAEEQPDGSFRLEMFNDEPWAPPKSAH